MQEKIYTNLLQVDIMQLYKHLKESMQKWDMNDINILTTEKQDSTLIVKS